MMSVRVSSLIPPPPPPSYKLGGYGPYLDYASQGVTLERNLVHGIGGSPFFGNSNGELTPPPAALPNVIRDNIFVHAHTRLDDDNNVLKMRTLGRVVFERNILYATAHSALGGDLRLVQAHDTQPQQMRAQQWDANVYYNEDRANADFGATWPGGANFSAWQAGGHDAHSALADPLFVDAAGGNFSLRAGSPALARGFVQFDHAQAGARAARCPWWVVVG